MNLHDIKLPPKPKFSENFPIFGQITILVGVLLLIVTLGYKAQIITLLKSKSSSGTNATVIENNHPQQETAQLSEQNIIAPSAYVYDLKNERVLYEKDATTVRPLASITKLMTALIAHELAPQDKKIAIPLAATMLESASGLKEDELFNRDSATTYALIASSNDSAYALADAVGKTLDPDHPQKAFVTAMNIRAEELELASLKFLNPTGLDISQTEAGAFGNAKDVSLLVKYLLSKYPEMFSISAETTAQIPNASGNKHQIKNTNQIINQIPTLLGSKTGYTDLAGGNLTLAFDAGYNRPIIITILGSTYDGRFRDMVTLVKAVRNLLDAEPNAN